MLEMRHAGKVYPGGAVALEDINVHIRPGEFVFLVGPSGAGKSTFIRLISREIEPTSGQILVDGVDVMKLKRGDIPYLRRQLGIVFQDFRLLNDRTAYENVAFAMQVIEAPSHKIRQRVNEVLELVGLKGRGDNYPGEMSGGEQQRVAIARAIVNDPLLVIADEPTGNLDPETSKEIMEIFTQINSRGTTILMATHDKTMVDYMQKRVIALENGRLVRDDRKGVYGYEV
ncbi:MULTISPECIES: cell division ATP-binding protein FtsE [Acidaminococcus]|jgi:cell division transport system ATP-binding protein|uniref:cell division ATP-binding protein FtsE n=1 Tax=Acidaminococcus TaxID=904 RepID=UPI000336F22B|nr:MULTISPECIES: cell division ATP-binding protein FtsE [Acidaminococcus]MEE1598622.1 cell division ATP-binding protein FtsE [Acidaminococcus fermentans]MEE4122884.1 cell division ATP-binding protein FtsE [Acidaminococcus fermentans]CDE94382.1 cell division ATP-binding protein FtsE [Acidaminococcus sp. CAG:542]